MTLRPGIEYLEFSRIQGPLIFVKGVRDVGFRELAEVEGREGEVRLGRVLSI